MRMLKRLILLSLTILMSLNFVHTVNAYEYGSIELAFNNEYATNISFSIYKIGDCIDGSLVQYVPSSDFSNIMSDLKSLVTANDCENVIEESMNYIYENDIQPIDTKLADNDGNVLFEELDIGLYLITQDEYSDKFEAETFLVQMPMNIDSSMKYNIVAVPKYTDKTGVKNDDKETPDKLVNVKTGDDQDITPYIVTLGISVITFLLIYVFMKSDKKDVK